MFDTKAFRQAVLNQAMQGKLTKQLPEDGNASELLRSIDNEKQRFIKEGKIKKQRSLPDIDPNEIPFEIPGSWQWVRLNDIGQWKAGSTPRRDHPEYYNGDIPWVKTGDLNDHLVNNTSESITNEGLNHSSLTINPIGSVLIAMYGATIAKLGILNITAVTNQACCACVTYDDMDNKFLFYYLMSQRRNFIALGAGGAQPNISRTKIIHYLIPLPPLAEQKRIVDQINKCFKLADLIDDEHELNRNFSTNMHKSLLTAAMQGKLTQQLPEDGNASELLRSIENEKQRLIKEGKIKKQKALPDIDPDEIPFEIPDNWKWVRLGTICMLINGRAYKQNELLDDEKLTPVLRVGNLFTSKKWYYSNLKLDESKYINNGDLIYSWSASFGPSIWKGGKVIYHYHIWKIFNYGVVKQFLYDLLLFITDNDNSNLHGTSMKHITKSIMEDKIIPLPPFAEQQRIVKSLDSTFDKLNKMRLCQASGQKDI